MRHRRLATILLVLGMLTLAVGASAQNQTLRVTTRTNLRDAASNNGNIVVPLNPGDELEVLDRMDAWYHVRVKSSGRQGYVNALVVQVVAAPRATPAPPASQPPVAAPTPAPAPAAQTPAAQPILRDPARPAPGRRLSDRSLSVRILGGLLADEKYNNPGGGGGVVFRPIGQRLEVQGDVFYARVLSEDANVLEGSANALVNLTPSQSLTPFAGAGVLVFKASGGGSAINTDTQTAFQLLGGFEKSLGTGLGLRLEVRLQVFSETRAVLAAAGFTF